MKRRGSFAGYQQELLAGQHGGTTYRCHTFFLGAATRTGSKDSFFAEKRSYPTDVEGLEAAPSGRAECMIRSPEERDRRHEVSRHFLRLTANAYLAECFARETSPHANELAARLECSPSQLNRVFLRHMGVIPSTFLKAACVERAKHLLATTTLRTATVGYQAGFGTRTTFFRAFKRVTGMTPQQYREVVCGK